MRTPCLLLSMVVLLACGDDGSTDRAGAGGGGGGPGADADAATGDGDGDGDGDGGGGDGDGGDGDGDGTGGAADAGIPTPGPYDGRAGADGRVLFHVENADGELTLGVLYLPAGDGPHPAVVVLHGSGGLVDEPADRDDGQDPQWDPVDAELESQFERWAALLTAAGYVVAMPASFFSRGFHDWNDDPHPGLDAEARLRFRVFDLRATLDVLLVRKDVRPEAIGLVGFSNGASTVLLGMQTDVHAVAELAGLPAFDAAADFRTAIAYYPGCGLQGFVSLSSPDAYLPRAPVLIQHATLDPLLEHCPTRDAQAEAAALTAGIGGDPLLLEVFGGEVGHGFDSTPDTPDEVAARDAAEARTLSRLGEALGG